MELDWLETLVAVVDRGGFLAASGQVHRSQSRVSAHIAGLERELGVVLIDRTARPTRPTAAGEVVVRYAREIIAGVESTRSAVDALRGMDRESLAVLTTPCIGSALFPGVLARLVAQFPEVRLGLSEQSRPDLAGGFMTEGVVVAVVPRIAAKKAPGLNEQVLWEEPFRVLVRRGDVLAHGTGEIGVADLAGRHLIVTGMPADEEPEAVGLLAVHGVASRPRAVVNCPETLTAMVRSGLGVGVMNAVAMGGIDVSGLVVRDVAPRKGLAREVAAYWYDVLLSSRVGVALHRTVLDSPLPTGAVPAEPGALRSWAAR